MKKVVLVLAAVFAMGQTAFAVEGEVSVVSNRMSRRAGAYIGILGDPFPTLVGVNLGYNVFDFMRASAGLGRISASSSLGDTSATTLGVTAKFFVPGWSLSPTAGLGFAYVAVSSSGGAVVSVQNFTESGAHVYAHFGVDYQAAGGFNVGAGYNVSFKSGVGGAPYINVGWFVDWLS